jgi:hypothetical protein
VRSRGGGGVHLGPGVHTGWGHVLKFVCMYLYMYVYCPFEVYVYSFNHMFP